jgi:hypothetical protein
VEPAPEPSARGPAALAPVERHRANFVPNTAQCLVWLHTQEKKVLVTGEKRPPSLSKEFRAFGDGAALRLGC